MDELIRQTLKGELEHPYLPTHPRGPRYEVQWMAALEVMQLTPAERRYVKAKLAEMRDPKWQDAYRPFRYPNMQPYEDAYGNWHYPTLERVEQPPSFSLRGFLFVVVQVLPEVGSKKLIRKVIVVPKNFEEAARAGFSREQVVAGWPEIHGLQPRAPGASITPSQHVLGEPQSQFSSASSSPIGSPLNADPSNARPGRAVIIDLEKAKRMAGVRIVTTDELVKDLQQLASAATSDAARTRIRETIEVVRKLEHEALIEGTVGKGAIKAIMPREHMEYIKKGEELVRRYMPDKEARAAGEVGDTAKLQAGLADLERQYAQARKLGRAGRVLGVIGAVFTVRDLYSAGQRSWESGSVKPFVGESIRQTGGWAFAAAGSEFGFKAGAALGIETGPGAIVTGVIGAAFFGAAGYFLGDQISWALGLDDDDDQ